MCQARERGFCNLDTYLGFIRLRACECACIDAQPRCRASAHLLSSCILEYKDRNMHIDASIVSDALQ